VAIPVLRGLGVLDEVALYGALIHVVSQDPQAHRPQIEAALRGQGVRLAGAQAIAPSLEDVFIASVRRLETGSQA
jgi:hypothetical protein